ncbi:hydroxymethylbilane synthase [Microbacterium radiodurans]|uniref:Hydroxymethylbilane synthase n=1 Tax=Microbacterium radiodurans TaxID=661398 RepID=A0A5J5IQ86_9MICO|nr:hydroxymethylbilane synthase [Microbacterium radiodurans]KAA9086579.1 hydroxymethylbilane synthase [Microbacterium radiodurans]
MTDLGSAGGASLRLGTRASLLATTQSQHVADAITAATGIPVVLVEITTDGDVLTGSLAQMGGTGVFATALREALLRGDCDLVVHSMKDLPTAPYPGLEIAAVPPRAPQRDVLCGPVAGASLDALPEGAVVGTGSPRRVAQLLSRRPDLQVRDIRGNIDTRLRKMRGGEYDAIVLAEAGLRRIDRGSAIGETFGLDRWPTSAGQGALAVEIRSGDADGPIGRAVRLIDDAESASRALLERAVLRRLEAGCAAPVGISATGLGADTTFLAEVYAPGGERTVRATRSLSIDLARADERERIAADVVAELLDGGAADIADLPGTSR